MPSVRTVTKLPRNLVVGLLKSSERVLIMGETPENRYSGGNRVLDALPQSDRAKITRHVRVVHFASGDVAQQPDGANTFIDFPIDAVLSIVTTMLNGSACEVGTIGNEGASGVEVAFGATLLRTTICQVEGDIARIDRVHFLAALDENRQFERLIGRVAQAQRFFVEQQCACNAMHSLDERCARWIMMIHQRVHRDTFSLTHEFLSMMLGVRRATVSRAAMKLQDAGIITYRRGSVNVLSARRLASECCECYDATRNVFDSSLLTTDKPLSEAVAS
jgi:DNA-binding transcriptional ArsR family regulator